ncbi:MAG: zinc-ribbon domain-containing protein [Candidatus Howiella sp.]
MFCRKCGNTLPDDSAFCPRCGAAVAPPSPEGNPSADTDFDPADIAANKGLCVTAYFWILFFLPMVIRPESKYCRFHSNQGLLFLIFSGAVSIVRELLAFVLRLVFRSVFGLGWLHSLLSGLLGFAAGALILGMMVIGIYHALNGKTEGLPVIGKIRLL